MASTPGLTNDPGESIPTGLAPSAGLAGPGGGLSFQGFNLTPAVPYDIYWDTQNLVWGGNQLQW